jgi:hypothetical protein
MGIVLLAAIFSGLIQSRRSKSSANQIESIQKRAKELTGANLIGSAVHVAGHPKLELKQPVVLVLREDRLAIYPYDKSTPLDEIDVHEIETVFTVVYDEDRIPHIDVIDPTAQALQFKIHRQGKTW